MSDSDAFLGRALGLVVSLHGALTPGELAQVQHLIDHGEIGESMVELSWIIVNGNKPISRITYDTIKELSTGLVNEDHMAPTLADHVVAGELPR